MVGDAIIQNSNPRNFKGLKTGARVYSGCPRLRARSAVSFYCQSEMLQCWPAGWKQMDARLNMHGWSSDIVLRAACWEAGLQELAKWILPVSPARTIKGFLEPSSGSEKGASFSSEA